MVDSAPELWLSKPGHGLDVTSHEPAAILPHTGATCTPAPDRRMSAIP